MNHNSAHAAPYKAHILERISHIDRADWNGLIAAPYNPFLSWDFLNALEQTGCAAAPTGWMARHIWLMDHKDRPAGAVPLYVKSHSQGEYVFDQGWAEALHRAGGAYYPKLQVSVPFTPVAGPRLLASDQAVRTALLSALIQLCHDWDMSGAHLTFLNAADQAACREAGFLMREDRQFHFFNRGYDSFNAFLAALSSRKRKNIRKERQLAQAGITIKRLSGSMLRPEHWDIFYACYQDTGGRKWGSPYLNRAFFAHIHETMADEILLIIAYEDDTPIACALNFIGAEALYGRYWGALIHKPFLHFELCYYQAIEEAIERGLSRVEAGAQGEHKLARGYEPCATWSAHYLANAGFHTAIAQYLTRERLAVEHEINILARHTPFKKESL